MRIDWRAYFDEFSRVHGGEPVLIGINRETGTGGMLLFPDGWRYGREQPSGPEIPPGSPEAQERLIKAYWKIRQRTILEEVNKARENIRGLVFLQQSRSAPLVSGVKVIEEDDDGKRRSRMELRTVDFQLLIEKYQELRAELKRCEDALACVIIPYEQEIPVISPAAVITALEEIDRIYGGIPGDVAKTDDIPVRETINDNQR